MTRANARELAVHLIYGRDFTGEEPDVVVATRLNEDYYGKLAPEHPVYTDRPTKAQLKYLDCVVSGVANRAEELDGLIRKYAIGWDISRISRLARTVMQLAMFEAMYVEDVPVGVAISEAVRIVKFYDGEEVSAFVNGILGAFARQLDSEVKP